VAELRAASRRQDETTAAEARERLAQRKDEPERIAQQAVEEARRKEQEPSATNDRINQALAAEERDDGQQRADQGRREAPSQVAAQDQAREEAQRRLDSENRLQAVERYNRARREQEEAARNLMDHEPISARRQRVGELAAAEPQRPAALEAELSNIEALDRKTRELAKDRRSTAPAEIRKAQEERDARLSELTGRDLDREARAYVDWTRQSIEAKASLMETDTDLAELRSAKEKADAAVLRTQEALAEVSRTVNDLLRSGPEYQRLSRNPGPDEVMEPKEWEQQRDQWRARGREIALQVDHLVAVAEIARSREMNRFLEVYERSSPKNRLDMEKDLVAAFDTRANLVRMVDEVNRKKSDQGWGSLTASQVSPFYQDGHLRKMREREDRMRGELAKKLAELADRYEKLRRA
jgi:colicin import membrane protein